MPQAEAWLGDHVVSLLSTQLKQHILVPFMSDTGVWQNIEYEENSFPGPTQAVVKHKT